MNGLREVFKIQTVVSVLYPLKRCPFYPGSCVTSSFVPLTYHVSSKNGLFEPVLKNMTNVLISRTCLSLLRFFPSFLINHHNS